jgi:hypothetical protein
VGLLGVGEWGAHVASVWLSAASKNSRQHVGQT